MLALTAATPRAAKPLLKRHRYDLKKCPALSEAEKQSSCRHASRRRQALTRYVPETFADAATRFSYVTDACKPNATYSDAADETRAARPAPQEERR